MAGGAPTIVAVSERLYRLALVAYPPGFRQDYGGEMVRLFRDCCRSAHRQQGALGVIVLWIAILADLVATALIERFTRRSPMSNGRLVAWGALASLLSGALWITVLLPLQEAIPLYTHAAWHMVNAAAALLALGGLVGLYARYGPAAGRLGQAGLLLADIGAALAFVGNGLEGLFEWEVGWAMFMLGMLALAVGLPLFAWAMWAGRDLPRWSVLPHLGSGLGLLLVVVVSVAGRAGGLLTDEHLAAETSPLLAVTLIALIALFGLGWMTLGYCLWADRGERAVPPSLAAG